MIGRGSTPRVIENAGRLAHHAVDRRIHPTRTSASSDQPPSARPSPQHPERTFFAIKRLIGRTFEDPTTKKDQNLVPYNIVRGGNGDAWVESDGKTVIRSLSQDLGVHSSFKKMKETAESHLGHAGHPSRHPNPCRPIFNDAQRQVHQRRSGKIAGLEVLRIINEPTAAALAYGLDKKQTGTIAVYDLGGGTFDVSILEIGDGVFEVKSTNGDTFLGGEDFDMRVVEYLAAEFKKDQGIDLTKDKLALPAPQGGRREGEDRALVHDADRDQTCPTSPPTRRAPSTSR